MEKFVQIADEGAMIVMGRYEQQPHEQSAYQSEAALEESFIQKLVSQGYERLHINNETDLLANLRKQQETAHLVGHDRLHPVCIGERQAQQRPQAKRHGYACRRYCPLYRIDD